MDGEHGYQEEYGDGSAGDPSRLAINRRRNQVIRACENCIRLHAKCEDTRPCKRCMSSCISCVPAPVRKRGRRQAIGHYISSPDAFAADDDSSDENHEYYPQTTSRGQRKRGKTRNRKEEEVPSPSLSDGCPSAASSAQIPRQIGEEDLEDEDLFSVENTHYPDSEFTTLVVRRATPLELQTRRLSVCSVSSPPLASLGSSSPPFRRDSLLSVRRDSMPMRRDSLFIDDGSSGLLVDSRPSSVIPSPSASSTNHFMGQGNFFPNSSFHLPMSPPEPSLSRDSSFNMSFGPSKHNTGCQDSSPTPASIPAVSSSSSISPDNHMLQSEKSDPALVVIGNSMRPHQHHPSSSSSKQSHLSSLSPDPPGLSASSSSSIHHQVHFFPPAPVPAFNASYSFPPQSMMTHLSPPVAQSSPPPMMSSFPSQFHPQTFMLKPLDITSLSSASEILASGPSASATSSPPASAVHSDSDSSSSEDKKKVAALMEECAELKKRLELQSRSVQFQESINAYQKVFECSSRGILFVGIEGGFVLGWNKAACELLGYEESDLGKTIFRWRDLMREEAWGACLLRFLQAVQSSQRNYEIEYLLQRKDKSEVQVRVEVTIIPSEQGAPAFTATQVLEVLPTVLR